MTLSGGMKRRVLISKALAHEPDVLFLDEPTAGVDVELRQDMWNVVQSLRESGVTVILTTHYIEEAEQLADRVGVITNGELILVQDKTSLMKELGKKQMVVNLSESITAIPEGLSEYRLELSEDGMELTYHYDTKQERTGITSLLSEMNAAGIHFNDLSTSQSSLEDAMPSGLKIGGLKIALLATLLSFTLNVKADDSSWERRANIDLQSRFFTQDAKWPGQSSQAGAVSLAFSAEFRWRDPDADQRISLIPYLRLDGTDSDRSLVDLPEAYWAFEGDSYEFLVGANTVFWGVTESVHLVDIINQTDAVADIDGEDKLGQPMLNLELQRDWGLIGLYVMPYFRERTFAGNSGRFRAPLPVDSDAAVYESGDEQNHIDLALRYSHYIGDVDLGVSWFSGTSREPRLLLNADATALVPYYDLIDQVGFDLQYTRDAWLWKLEAIARDGATDSFVAAVGGVEYTVYQLRDSSTDLGLLLEYQYDARAETEPLTLADNDIFVGARLALNDVQDSTALLGFAYDLDTGATFVNIEADRRFGQNYVAELRIRLFTDANREGPLFAISSDDYLQLQLSRYF